MDLLEAARAEMERAVRALPQDCWDRPTPAQMPVRELVEHVVVGNRFTAMLLAGVSREEAMASLDGDRLGGDPAGAVVESGRQQVAAFAAAAKDQPVAGPRGVTVSAAAFLRFRLVDLVVHAWDLRRAAGLDESLDPDVVLALLEVVEPHLDEMLAMGAYGEGPSGTLPEDASPQERLLDLFGRRP